MGNESRGDALPPKRKFTITPSTGAYLALFVLIVIAIFATSFKFLSVSNIFNVIREGSIVGIVAVGMSLVVLMGGIDLSAGSVVTLGACLFSGMTKGMSSNDIPDLSMLVFVFVVIVGAVIGLINGLLIVYRRVEPFIITLGMMTMLQGVVLVYTGGSPTSGLTQFWKDLGSKLLFGSIPYPVIIFAAIVLIFVFVMKRSVYGRYIYAIGGNDEAARLSGIKVNFYRIITYCLCSALAIIAGMILACRVGGSPNATIGSGYELNAIAGVVIGGTTMAGGSGSLPGTIEGILIIAVLKNVIALLGVDPLIQKVIEGIIIIIAVSIQRKGKLA